MKLLGMQRLSILKQGFGYSIIYPLTSVAVTTHKDVSLAYTGWKFQN